MAVFGLGGVGSFAAEALARAGVGRLVLVDGDTVSLTNLNRQLVALHSTLGQSKAQVMAQRVQDINPDWPRGGTYGLLSAGSAAEFSQRL